MELIGKVSKGSKMDQIYIPKRRDGLRVGDYVVIRLLETQKSIEKPYFYGIKSIEPVKLRIASDAFKELDKKIEKYDNLIITGSFLDKGFSFKDIDILIISGKKIDAASLKNSIEGTTGIRAHIILLNNKTLIDGLSTDPLYQTMLSRCISKRRIIYKIKRKIDYKILDLGLLKSKTLIDNFDDLNGNEKYYLTRNMISIMLYVRLKNVNQEKIDNKIKDIFNLKDINEIKENMLDKNKFLKKYRETYKKTFNLIMESIKHGPKQG